MIYLLFSLNSCCYAVHLKNAELIAGKVIQLAATVMSIISINTKIFGY